MAKQTPVVYMRDGVALTPNGERIDSYVDRATEKGAYTPASTVADIAHLGVTVPQPPSPGELSALAMNRMSDIEEANHPGPEDFEAFLAQERARIHAEVLEDLRAKGVEIPDDEPATTELTPGQKAALTRQRKAQEQAAREQQEKETKESEERAAAEAAAKGEGSRDPNSQATE